MASEFSVPWYEERHGAECEPGFPTAESRDAGPRSLVAYYSLSGHTRALAHAIRDASAGQLEEIAEPRARIGFPGEMRALVDSLLRRAPPIRTPVRDPAQHELLFLGGPVWAGRIAAPVRTYARTVAARARDLAFFCTMMPTARQPPWRNWPSCADGGQGRCSPSPRMRWYRVRSMPRCIASSARRWQFGKSNSS
jgi:flavodoxin